MKINFGAISYIPANTVLKNGYTLFDWVMRQKGFPEFWGRQISGENAITTDEITYLRSKGCKICLLYNDFSELKISGNAGADDGHKAVEVAKKLGVPRGEDIVIYADINPEWSINHNWMLSFAGSLVASGYACGFIGNTDSSKNFNFDRQSSHFMESIRYRKYMKPSFGATEPKLEDVPQKWTPFCPSAIEPEDVDLWLCGETKFYGYKSIDVYAKDKTILEKMW